jgi:DNA adenine methylase
MNSKNQLDHNTLIHILEIYSNDLETNSVLQPFLKWPGGKRWFIQNHSKFLPIHFNRYFEPFLGGGAIYFHLQPKNAFISDINPDIIEAYSAIKNHWKSLKRSLQYHHRNHSINHYYKIREREHSQLIQSASRMIYLNRTCFNGIYRVNQEGKFNVPIGSKTNVILDTDDFKNLSDLLKNTRLSVCDFEVAITQAKRNDLVFADPPYTVRHNLNGFVKYNETLFSWDDQVRLAKVLHKAKDRGVKIVLTNANHSSIRDLYNHNGFHLETVSRYSSIAASSNNRKQYNELVITSHPNN